MTQDEALRLFDQVDANDDHVITFDEFLAFGRAHPEYVEVFLHWRQTLADDPDVPRSPGAAAGSGKASVDAGRVAHCADFLIFFHPLRKRPWSEFRLVASWVPVVVDESPS